MTEATPIAPDWLALRRPVDDEARRAADPLVDRCAAYLRAAPAPRVVLDLGAGTGANRAYLEPRLGVQVRWVLVDHDPALLELATPDSIRVQAPVSELPALLRSYQPALVTCSALLDLLTQGEITGLVAAVAAARLPALFALSVDGLVRFDPPHADDEALMAAFDRHQARAGRAGPAAAAMARGAAEASGLVVTQMATPWRLTATNGDAVVGRFLTERVASAVEQDPALSGRGARWLEERLAQSAEGRLTVVVGHEDLLLEPPRAVGE